MLSFDGSWLARPVLLALGCGSLLGFGGCGGAASGELGGALDGDGGTSGRTGGSGSTGGSASVGGSASMGGSASTGGSGGGTGGRGGRGGGGSGSAGTGSGGVGGTSGGISGFSGSAGSFSNAGSAGAGGLGFGGAAGAAGSSSMPGSSLCVDLSSGLAGLPSQAFPADDAMVREYCGTIPEDYLTYQAICLPAPGNGQSCTSFYPDYLINLLYECGESTSASFLCGPHRPLPNTDGCSGNECCYVLAGDCVQR